MNYKALMVDVDGTLSPYSTTAYPLIPRNKVEDAIEKASRHIHIGLATSRPLVKVESILKRLNLSGYSILQNGAQIVDSESSKTVWSRPIDTRQIPEIYKIISNYDLQVFYSNFRENLPLRSLNDLLHQPISDIFLDGIAENDFLEIKRRLEEINAVAIHQLSSRWDNKLEISLTHVEATKEFAIHEVATLLGISTEEIIGVGDAANDLPLLRACGLKIAMGNAVDELKAISDVVAPSVDEDGVAWIIEKYILNSIQS